LARRKAEIRIDHAMYPSILAGHVRCERFAIHITVFWTCDVEI
jgi:hypothetical protein